MIKKKGFLASLLSFCIFTCSIVYPFISSASDTGITDYRTTMYTTPSGGVYHDPECTDEIMAPLNLQDYEPVCVTGITNNGSYRIDRGDGRTLYINKDGLTNDLDPIRALLTRRTVSLPNSPLNTYDATDHMWVVTPKIITFFDCNGYYNIAVTNNDSSDVLSIYRFDPDYNLASTITIPYAQPLFGSVTCDNSGNYYAVFGQSDDSNSQSVAVTTVVKYDYNGTFLTSQSLNGFESTPYTPGDSFGTRIPFHAGTCSLAINDGILACTYAREMYNGHQSNFVFYLNCSDLSKMVEKPYIPYTSHSFDQAVIPTSEGGFLFADHGDAYPRAFNISKVNDLHFVAKKDTFHFREGTDRDHGYNETFAQLGGIIETAHSYVLCASSERKLSLSVLPHIRKDSDLEARDMFIQIMSKDLKEFKGGEQRLAVGVHTPNSLTEQFLSNDVKDEGVIWLTALDDNCYVNNPKIVKVSPTNFVLLWEEREYDWRSNCNAYFMVVNEDGTIIQPTTHLGNMHLPGNDNPVFHDGAITWVSNDNAYTWENFINGWEAVWLTNSWEEWDAYVSKPKISRADVYTFNVAPWIN